MDIPSRGPIGLPVVLSCLIPNIKSPPLALLKEEISARNSFFSESVFLGNSAL